MFRRKNKPLDLSFSDSNYQPAPNPNTLQPQAATGQGPKPVSESRQELEINKLLNAKTSLPSHSHTPETQLANQYNQQHRPVPLPPNSSNPPTIINNYYYVQPPIQPPPVQSSPVQSPPVQSPPVQSPPVQPPPVQSAVSQVKLQGSKSYTQHHLSSSRLPHYKYSQQKPKFSIEGYDEYEKSQTTSRASAYHEPFQSLQNINTPDKSYSSPNTLRSSPEKSQRIPSLVPSVSSLNSTSSSAKEKFDIYSSASLINHSSHHLKSTKSSYSKDKPIIPVVFFDDSERSNEAHLKTNLISFLSAIEEDDINVHSLELYEIFSTTAGDNSLTTNTLSQILLDPFSDEDPFSVRSIDIIFQTFSTRGSNHEINFRSFIKLCKFVKGCYSSFNYHDKCQRHLLSFDEFQKALKFNGISCPDFLLADIFKHSNDVGLESYIVAIVLIRNYEKQNI